MGVCKQLCKDSPFVRGSARICTGVVAACALVAPASAAATTFTVSGTADSNAGCSGTVCPSLRAAITNAPAGSTIQLGSGTYTLSLGHLPITGSLTIAGVSSSQTTIDQTQSGPDIMFVSSVTSLDLALSNLTLTGAKTAGTSNNGEIAGAIDDTALAGSLTLTGVVITGNTSSGFNATTPPNGGGDAVGAIVVSSGTASLTVNNSTISNNTATGGHGADGSGFSGGAGGQGYGAVSDFAGPVTINNSTISGNTATGGTGGSLSVPGSGSISGQAVGALNVIEHATTDQTTINQSTISGNAAIGGTGGAGSGGASGGNGNSVFGTVSFSQGILRIQSSTISGNTATASTGGSAAGGGHGGNGGTVLGGGISVDAGSAAIVNSTIAGNAVRPSSGGTGSTPGTGGDGEGGGIDDLNGGPLTLVSDTIAGNTAPQGGNLDMFNKQLTIADTIFSAGSAAFSPNCGLDTVTVTDDGHNLEDTTPSQCGLSGAKQDLIGQNPLLGPLAANGPPTMTELLLSGSPALHAGGTCTDFSNPPANLPLAIDQRGRPRHIPCDIGAVEDQAPANTGSPQIAGTFALGNTLTCAPGTWVGDAPSFTYQWQRDGVAIPGATQASYTITPDDYGPVLACWVTATGPGGSARAVQYASATSACPCPPTLSGARQTHAVWRMGNALAKISARRRIRKKRPPVGTTFSFVLDVPAQVNLSFTKLVRGRTVNGKCAFQHKRNAHRPRCQIVIGAGSLQFVGHLGTNRVAFDGRVASTYKVNPGNYQVAISARRPVLGYPRSNVSTLRFTIAP